jgi:hypothetical protein
MYALICHRLRMADAQRPVRKHPKGLWGYRSFLGRSSGRGRVEEGSRRTAISFVISASGHRRIRSTSQLEWNLFLRADGGEWIGLCQRPDALAVRQIFGIGRDSGRFALPVDVWGLACRKLKSDDPEKPGWRIVCVVSCSCCFSSAAESSLSQILKEDISIEAEHTDVRYRTISYKRGSNPVFGYALITTEAY